jgi:hypothetical protein
VDETVYDAAGGAEGLLALAQAWHERCLADPVVAHAFSHGSATGRTRRWTAGRWLPSCSPSTTLAFRTTRAAGLGLPKRSWDGLVGD